MPVKLGPKTLAQLEILRHEWPQGDHVLVTGGTGSGKTRLARELDEIRVSRGSHVVVFVSKLRPDSTITTDYKGFRRWKSWPQRKPSITEQRILLWPGVEGKTAREAKAIMQDTFTDALDSISRVGYWTVHIDEGLFLTAPRPGGMGMGSDLGIMYQLMRSSKATMITLAQRPSHLPLSLYANVSHVFAGRASELSDLKRLSNLDGISSRAVAQRINTLGKHDFLWLRPGSALEPQVVNLAQ